LRQDLRHPANVSAPATCTTSGFFEAGPYPRPDWTWDEFIDIAQRLTKRDDRASDSLVSWGHSLPNEYKLFLHMGPVYNEWGTRSALDAPQAGEAVQFMQDFIHKHRVAPTLSDENSMASAGGWGTNIISLLAVEKGAMAIGGRWWLLTLRNKDYANLRLGVVELPKGPSGRIVGNGKATLVNKAASTLTGNHVPNS
jgi:ABC-type glycerol-3-phosphate transport system substrate-binding protein